MAMARLLYAVRAVVDRPLQPRLRMASPTKRSRERVSSSTPALGTAGGGSRSELPARPLRAAAAGRRRLRGPAEERRRSLSLDVLHLWEGLGLAAGLDAVGLVQARRRRVVRRGLLPEVRQGEGEEGGRGPLIATLLYYLACQTSPVHPRRLSPRTKRR